MKKMAPIWGLLFVIFSLSAGHAEIPRPWEFPNKECDPQNISLCFSQRDQANLPFEIRVVPEGQKTPYVALLLHGLSDSPYFFKDIAPIFAEKGINVLALRYTGHGTDVEQLRQATKEQWIEDLSWAIDEAATMGDKVILVGFSAGGVLATYALEELADQAEFAGLIFFAGSLRFRTDISGACITDSYVGEKTYGVGVRYQKIPTKAACQLYQMIQSVLRLPPPFFPGSGEDEPIDFNLSTFARSLSLPFFQTINDGDATVDNQAMLKISELKPGPSHLFHISNGNRIRPGNDLQLTEVRSVENLPHSSIMLRDSDFTTELNPHFDQMEQAIEAFLDENFALSEDGE